MSSSGQMLPLLGGGGGGSHREKQCLRNLDQRRHCISHKYSRGKSSHPLNLPPQAKKKQSIQLYIDNASAQCAIIKLSCKSQALLQEITLLVKLIKVAKSTEYKNATHLDNTERKSRCIKQIFPSFS